MPVSRRRIPVVRLLLLALAAAAFAAAGAQLARGADGEAPVAGSVTIVPSDGRPARTVALADVAGQQDVHDAVYTLRAADGATSPLPVAAGISLEALVRAAGLDQDAFTYVEIARPDGSSAFVLRDQLAVGQGGPPVVWSDEQGVHFLRSSLTDEDPNAADHIVQPGGELQISLHVGDPLAARISASALRARPGQAISFSAMLVAGTLEPGMSFRWYFDGAAYKYGASVSHRFRRAGTYNVLLNVVRGEDAVGPPEVVEVVIERPRRPRDGARRSDQSRDDDGDGAGRSGTGDGAGAGTGGGSGGGVPGGTGSGAPFTPVTAAPTAPPVAAPPPEPPPARRAPRAPEPQGELVSGTLLASASGPPPAAGGGTQAAAARDGAPADPLDVPVGVWIVIGLGAIVALGWTLESRHTLPFWQP